MAPPTSRAPPTPAARWAGPRGSSPAWNPLRGMKWAWLGFSVGGQAPAWGPVPREKLQSRAVDGKTHVGQRGPTRDSVSATVSPPRFKVILGLKKEQATSVHQSVGKKRSSREYGSHGGGGRASHVGLFLIFKQTGPHRFLSSALTHARTIRIYSFNFWNWKISLIRSTLV